MHLINLEFTAIAPCPALSLPGHNQRLGSKNQGLEIRQSNFVKELKAH